MAPVAAANPTVASNLGTLPSAIKLGEGVNQYQLDYMRQGIPNYAGNLGALSSQIGNFLNPADAQANYDVSMHGAEGAIAGGIPGSPAAGQSTGRLRQADIERRAALGANLLGQEVSWLPKPYDISQQFLDPNIMAQLQSRTASEPAHILTQIAAQQRGANRGYGGSYGFNPMAGTVSRTPAPIARTGGSGTSAPPSLPPTIGGGGPSEEPPPGATIYQNPDGSWGWGYAPPPTNPLDLIPDTAIPDPILFGTSWTPGTPNPYAPEQDFEDYFW